MCKPQAMQEKHKYDKVQATCNVNEQQIYNPASCRLYTMFKHQAQDITSCQPHVM